MENLIEKLGYNPHSLKRELKKYYISATDEEINLMLTSLNKTKLTDLFKHLSPDILLDEKIDVAEYFNYENLISEMERLASKNNTFTSFIGSGLKAYKVSPIVPEVCNVRGLTTAYTSYQPERGQGTLISLYLYSSLMSMLTGFEAVNSSMYERSSALFEALNCAKRLMKGKKTILVAENIYKGDKEVLHTSAKHTSINLLPIPMNKETGRLDVKALKELITQNIDDLAAIAFPQINTYGVLENVNELTDIASANKIKSIAIVDPMTLAKGGLLRPSEFGSDNQGVTMIVGEAQQVAIGPNFGGPGLGLFGIRYNDKDKLGIRHTAGRFVGKAKDEFGKEAFCMVLSTREQHIRREKANSNICSNQAFLATAAGASLLERGDVGLSEIITHSTSLAKLAAKKLQTFKGVSLRFPTSPFHNEFILNLPGPGTELIEAARKEKIHVGVIPSELTPNAIQIYFSDLHSEKDITKLENIFSKLYEAAESNIKTIIETPSELKNNSTSNIPKYSFEELKSYYNKLGELNFSPDDAVYPLGSCTMKYNPYINDWAASLSGFTDIHPEAPIEDAQGSLEILYQTQEIFKNMTGLAAVTTQPVAGAHGELTGIKLFQAYHAAKNENRDILLIPKSAHGTNPATATMAGFETKNIKGEQTGIILVDADEDGQVHLGQIKEFVTKYGNRIAGVMVTNPNTSGIFEANFKEMAKLIHSVDGLVYMDGANMNAIAGIVDLQKLGVDAVHNNLHKTWSIPHGGGGPGHAIVAVSEKLVDFLPGKQITKNGELYEITTPKNSIGSVHRHFGNFAHNVRCYTYLSALGTEGIRKMSQVAVLSSNYLLNKIRESYPLLPKGTDGVDKMHEFIITLEDELFTKIAESGTPKPNIIAKVGKMFLDFGLHAPTVAFPEMYGLMIEPTETFDKEELDRFTDVVLAIKKLIIENPEVLKTAPHFTPVSKIDEVSANKQLILSETLKELPKIHVPSIEANILSKMSVEEVTKEILKAHTEKLS